MMSTRLDADLVDAIDNYCTTHKISKRQLIEQSIMQFIANKNSD